MLDFNIKTDPAHGKKWLETSISGKLLLTTPQLNKGTAFSRQERCQFGLIGKLPAQIESLEEQAARAYLQFQSYDTPLQKNIYLNKLHDTNQTLFYKLVQHHEREMIPIIYTPTVSIAVEKFSREFQQARGLYISYENRYQIEEILDNRSNPEIDLIVASDGGGVLGIGDQGVGAMLIPVAKLMAYTICGGVNPLRTLPILLDVGTDNEALLQDPFYLGRRHPRISGEQYYEFLDLLVAALKKKFPQAFVQWEDFGRDHARRILQRYQTKICSFNDDIQGTGATTLAALLAAVKSTNSTLTEQRIVIFGAGSAGTGIADQICDGMVRMGLSRAEARKRFWLIDRPGLLIADMHDLTPEQQPYARERAEVEKWHPPASSCGLSAGSREACKDGDAAELLSQNSASISLLEVINKVQPTVLIGCSARSRAFTQEVIQAMARYVANPIIFPISNPTEKIEAVPEDLLKWTNGQALIATGGPFEPILFNGELRHIAQCNNALVFPGIGLGVIAAKATQVTDNMLWAVCMALNRCAPIHQDPKAALLPSLDNAKNSAREIAIAIAQQAIDDGVAGIDATTNLAECIDAHTWRPEYLEFQKKASTSL